MTQWLNRIVAHGEEDPTQLLAHPDNFRVHPKAQQDALRDAIQRVGLVQQVVVNRTTGHVLDGHLRVELAISESQPLVPVSYVDVSEDEEAIILATLDPIAAMAGIDKDKLAALVAGMDDEDAALARVVNGLAAGPQDGLTDPDDVPEHRQTDIQRGDLFELGDHRLLCGDSTKAEDVSTVLAGETADLCLTDPPYGIGESYTSHNDTPQELERLIAGFFPLAQEYSVRVLLTPGNRNQWLYPMPDWVLCWFVSAGTGRNPWGFTCWHPILAYGQDPYLANGKGSRPDAISKIESSDNTLGHPCPKPVGVWSWVLERGSVNSGDIVYEPFCGSGTTIIAAEQLGRRCYAIEIEPSYCQVTIDRWEAFTGKTAVKIQGSCD